MSQLTALAQSPAADALITLFELDATMLGDSEVRRFTASAWQGSVVRFGGQSYTPIDIEAEGFEWQGTGAPPTPTLRIANTNMVLGALARDFDDLVGAGVTRLRTYRRFLDEGDSPDPGMHFPPELYRVERKTRQSRLFIEFELAVPFDQEGHQLPGRVMLRNMCTHTYRRWTGSGFDYSRATCPYTDTRYYDIHQQVVPASQDRCGKRLVDCHRRFWPPTGGGFTDVNSPANALPIRAFPGLARTRV